MWKGLLVLLIFFLHFKKEEYELSEYIDNVSVSCLTLAQHRSSLLQTKIIAKYFAINALI